MSSVLAAVATSVKDVSAANLNREGEATDEILTCSICMDTPEDRGVLDCVSAYTFCLHLSVRGPKFGPDGQRHHTSLYQYRLNMLMNYAGTFILLRLYH